jgi:hypothetical protein
MTEPLVDLGAFLADEPDEVLRPEGDDHLTGFVVGNPLQQVIGKVGHTPRVQNGKDRLAPRIRRV